MNDVTRDASIVSFMNNGNIIEQSYSNSKLAPNDLDALYDPGLLTWQLHEWVAIEETYDELPGFIISPEEMNDDMDLFQDACDSKENLIRIQASSAMSGGEFLVPSEGINNDRPFCGSVWIPESRPTMLPPGVLEQSKQLIAGDKLIVECTITKNGNNYHTGDCPSGKIYINLKFTSYIPNIGEKVLMIVRLKEADRSCPWACVKALKGK